MALNATQLIDHFSLTPHPEGGYYKETYRSSEEIHEECLPLRFDGERFFSTGILFLLRGLDFSAFHRIKSDEMWHFYDGTSLNIYVIDPQGNFELITLGKNFHYGETYQAVVRAGYWFAAEPADPEGFCFVGCSVAPGFDFRDLDIGKRESLISEFPQHAAIIKKLSRQG
jgi:predicted cupin superfamily sugar epimerase